MSPAVVASLIIVAVVVFGVAGILRKRHYSADPPELPGPSGRPREGED